MGNGVSSACSVIPEGLGYVFYDQESMNSVGYQNKSGSLHSLKGGKHINQDSAVFCQGYGSDEGVLCGVFDGHGEDGHKVSKIVRERLPLLLLDQFNAMTNENASQRQEIEGLESSETKFVKAFSNAFHTMDEEIENTRKVDHSYSGTTAVTVLKQGDDLWVANLGDSRAVLGTKTDNGVVALRLTTDLKPNLCGEADRIRRAKGRVFAAHQEPGVARAWLPHVNYPGIAMSRSFGDFKMKKHGLISTPVVTHHVISPNDVFILLASDGIWDVLSDNEVASIVCSAESEDMAARAVVEAALAVWKIKYVKPDDCTAVCLFL